LAEEDKVRKRATDDVDIDFYWRLFRYI
jgi:hypothetical protein